MPTDDPAEVWEEGFTLHSELWDRVVALAHETKNAVLLSVIERC